MWTAYGYISSIACDRKPRRILLEKSFIQLKEELKAITRRRKNSPAPEHKV